MEVDRNGLQVMDRQECLDRLRTATIGRLGLHANALPIVLPVNFLLTDAGIIVRTARGTKLEAATQNAVVAFEADEVDVAAQTGWSVLVTGISREITDPVELASVRELPLQHWAPGPAERYICVSLDLVSGRRILPKVPARLAADENGRAARVAS